MGRKPQRRAWKAQADRKRTPGGFVPMPKKRDKRRADRSRRWRGGEA
jgi:hypothetical protein